MKNIAKYSIASLLALVIAGCSGDAGFSGEEEKVEAVINSVELVQGESVDVKAGDTLSPANEETEINVEHIIGEDIKKVTLLAGEATLIYGSYDLEESN